MPPDAEKHTIGTFAHDALAPYGIASSGLEVNDKDVPPHGWTIAHDGRGAPYVCLSPIDDAEDEAIMLSKTDENGLVGYAWAHHEPGQRVAGIGVDLASSADFAGTVGTRFSQLLFSPEELKLTQEGADPLAAARVFAGKEAAFKACAPALRRHYRQEGAPQLFFEARDFEVLADGTARGIRRIGDAETGLATLGIARIELHATTLRDMALVLAVALGG